MKTTKNLGIWMDHSNAFLMEIINNNMTTSCIESAFTKEKRTEGMHKSELIMHNNEQQSQANYYKKIGETIRNFEDVILFGPTDAKHELINTLKSDHLFENIKIEVLNTDNMTKAQMQDFVIGHYYKK
jgi:hypothetical protein